MALFPQSYAVPVFPSLFHVDEDDDDNDDDDIYCRAELKLCDTMNEHRTK